MVERSPWLALLAGEVALRADALLAGALFFCQRRVRLLL
jgi:hypothetical protein